MPVLWHFEVSVSIFRCLVKHVSRISFRFAEPGSVRFEMTLCVHVHGPCGMLIHRKNV